MWPAKQLLAGPSRRHALTSVASLYPLARSLQASSAGRRRIGFCFDIDGVLKRGATVLPEGREALRLLSGENGLGREWPFVLLTNGGGVDEATRSRRLSDELGVLIRPEQLVQSHTIFRDLVPLYRDEPVLVVGGSGDRCRQTAEGYGFRKVYQPSDLLAWNPSLWPFHRLTDEERGFAKAADFASLRFGAILVMHDPEDWGLATQLICDLVRSGGSILPNGPPRPDQLPVYFSNPDLLWANEWTRSRFGQGAFHECLRAVYSRRYLRPLEATTGGKPSRKTFEYADGLLRAEAGRLDGLDPTCDLETFMVGDNPSSDIAGADAYGWTPLLVLTGVFKPDGRGVPPAARTFGHVLDAVRWALAEQGRR